MSSFKLSYDKIQISGIDGCERIRRLIKVYENLHMRAYVPVCLTLAVLFIIEYLQRKHA